MFTIICFTLKFTRLFGTDESYTLPSMFVTDNLRQCKDKKNLANDVHCELYFFAKVHYIFHKQPIYANFSSIAICFISFHTPFKG